MLLEKAQRAEKRFVLVDAGADIDQFQEPPGAQGRNGKMRKQFRKRLDIRHGGDAALGQQFKSLGYGFDVITGSKRTAQGVDHLDPFGETLPRGDRTLEAREVEMAMGVDQSRQQRARAEIHDGFAGLRAQFVGGPNCGDFRSFNANCAANDGRQRDRQDTVCKVQHAEAKIAAWRHSRPRKESIIFVKTFNVAELREPTANA